MLIPSLHTLLPLLLGASGWCYGEPCIATCPSSSGNSTHGVKVADPTNCYGYYLCSDPRGDGHFEMSNHTLDCGFGMFFNSSSSECASTANVTVMEWCHLCDPCAVECSVNGSLIPDPHDCQGYYQCIEGQFHDPPREVCDDGLIFDFTNKTCAKLEDQAKCFDACDPCQTVCVKKTRIPNPDDCRSYHICDPPGGMSTFYCGNGRVFNPVTLLCEEDEGEGCQPVCNPDSAPIDNSTDKSDGKHPALLWSMVVLGILIVGGVAFLCFISRNTISEKFQKAKDFSKKGTKDRDVTSEGNTRRDSPVVNPAYEEDINITEVKPSKSKPTKSKPVQDPQASGSNMDNPESVNSKGNKSYLSRANLFKFRSDSPSETQA